MVDTTPSMMSSLVIDCRSDTVTKPNKEMRQAMYNSVDEGVGDDVFGDDELVLDLEARLAMMFGKEKAVFVPSGTMANLIAVSVHCEKEDQNTYVDLHRISRSTSKDQAQP